MHRKDFAIINFIILWDTESVNCCAARTAFLPRSTPESAVQLWHHLLKVAPAACIVRYKY